MSEREVGVEVNPVTPEGRAAGRVEVAVVLRDLIAQLREHCQQPSCHCDIGQAADYAETRLRLSRDD